MASLTEAAKAVLEGKVLEEGAYPEVSPGKISNPNPVDPSTAGTANAKTLHPGTKFKEADPKHNEAEDLGGSTPTSTYKDNLGAKASGKKDTSRSSYPALKGETASKKVQAMQEEEEVEGDIVEEGIEMGEELESFIEEAIEAGLSEEEIIEAIDENFEFISEEEELEEDEQIEEETALEDYQVDMSEHVNALLEGENLSEEFHAKATTIFEAAVKAKLEEEVAILEQAYAETLEERVSAIMEQLADQVDDYLNYVVEQWVEENEVAIESSLRSELTEDFISGLRSLFAEHYIDIPEEEVSVVEELSSTVEELEAKLNEEIERNVSLSSALNESRKSELVAYVCDGLTDTQQEKLRGLAENVGYENDDQFIEKISTLRESYFPTTYKSDTSITSVDDAKTPQMIKEEAISEIKGPMANYVKALGRSLPK